LAKLAGTQYGMVWYGMVWHGMSHIYMHRYIVYNGPAHYSFNPISLGDTLMRGPCLGLPGTPN